MVLEKQIRVINVGVSGPGVVKRALEKVRGESFDVVAETIKKTAFKVTRMGQLVAKEASKRLRCSIWNSRFIISTYTSSWRFSCRNI